MLIRKITDSMSEKRHWIAPFSSVIITTLVVLAGVFACYTLIRDSKRDHIELVSALSHNNQETLLLKIIDERMDLPMETKVVLARTIASMATLKKLRVDVICGVIDVETGGTWKHKQVSKAGALGLMQLMWATAKPYLRAERIDPTHTALMDPVTNVICGINALADFREQAQDLGLDNGADYGVTLAMYNGGPKVTKANSYSQAVTEATKKFNSLAGVPQ